MLSRRKTALNESGQVIVLIGLLIPVFFALGAVVLDVGNWYVHKRHLQSQVDAAALAGGLSLYGCTQDTAGANANVAKEALTYAGDPTRYPSPAPFTPQENLQVQTPTDAHAVLNSTAYWSAGTATDGSGYDYTEVSTDADSPKIGPAGMPCYNGWVDVKATDLEAPLLWGLLPVSPTPKTVARVELLESVTAAGVLPLGILESNPEWVYAIIVNEDAPDWQTNPAAVVGAGQLPFQAFSPIGGGAFQIFEGALAGLNMNGANNYGVFILTSMAASAPSMAGSLDTICGQTPSPAGEVECFAYDGGGTDISHIHAYSDSSPAPAVRDARLVGGCGTDLSAPYFNLNADCSMLLQAQLALGVPSGTNPGSTGYCYTVTSSPAGTMTWSDTGGLGTWQSPGFTPAEGSGKNVVSITVTRRANLASCTGGTNTVLSNVVVAAAYAADDYSGPVQYLWVTKDGAPANSMNQDPSANLVVTVGLKPPLEDTPLTDPPLQFRIGRFNTPSQTQALDCNVSGASGWRDAIRYGCQAWSINLRNGDCSTPYPNPAAPDCVDAETGNFTVQGGGSNAYTDRFIPDGCVANPNNWNLNGYTVPPVSDPRWAQLFVLDPLAFSVPGKRTYPVRRFINVYVTAGDGLGCSGDVPASGVGRNELWGHVSTYATNDPDATVNQIKCSMTDGGVCVPVLVR